MVVQTTSPIIEMKDVNLTFDNGRGVSGLSFHLDPGTILGIIGPSGCGKTTTVRLLTGIYTPDSGEVCVFGKHPANFQEPDKIRIGYIPQSFILYPYLNTEENLHFMGGSYGMSLKERKARINTLLDFVELEEARKRLGKHLSGGMQRRLMLASALLHNPELILADEPTAGIDPILRARVWDNFKRLREEGHSIVITTQYVGEAAYCDYVAVMREGKLVTVDTPEGLRRQAMGGEVIHLKIERKNIFEIMKYLMDRRSVLKVEQVEGEKGGLYVYVKNAGRELPRLLGSIREQFDIIPRIAERYQPPFDDVFVRLVQRIEEEA
ncbi:MAG: ABC transporter ATP-binding protein [Chloroflexi bacterium]|nr:MAG: ABC transporter ATP-binding protein [Chloroflexota bacterium]